MCKTHIREGVYMDIDDINSHRPAVVKYPDSYRASIFQSACITTMGYILGNHNNIESFGTEYSTMQENGENRVIPIFKIKCTGNILIILGDYGIGSKMAYALVCGESVCIRITYRFTNQITQETEIKDLCEELYRLIMVLLHHDKIRLFEYRNMCGYYEFTEQYLKAIMSVYNLDSRPAEPAELR